MNGFKRYAFEAYHGGPYTVTIRRQKSDLAVVLTHRPSGHSIDFFFHRSATFDHYRYTDGLSDDGERVGEFVDSDGRQDKTELDALLLRCLLRGTHVAGVGDDATLDRREAAELASIAQTVAAT